MAQPTPSPMHPALRGAIWGGGVSGGLALLIAIGWGAFLLVTIVGLGACMGMANMMSVNNSGWGELFFVYLPTTWWESGGSTLTLVSTVGGAFSCLGVGASIALGAVASMLLGARR